MTLDTQLDAFEASRASAPTLRAEVVDALAEAPEGLTADEIAERLQSTPFSIRPRVCELRKTGRVLDSGRRRANSSGRNAAVWVLA